jgi:hypothetical protein
VLVTSTLQIGGVGEISKVTLATNRKLGVDTIRVTGWDSPDRDDDGVPDTGDQCSNSDLSPTVVIDGCDSGVPNTIFPSGCTFADLIAACAEGARNHGRFVRCVTSLTNDLKQVRIITRQQKSAIQSCAAQAHIP